MTEDADSSPEGCKVRHNARHGFPAIVATDQTVVVRFDSGIHECLADELEAIASIDETSAEA